MSVVIHKDGSSAPACVSLDDASPLPVGTAVLVSLARWEREHQTLFAHAHPVGVRVPNTADIAQAGAMLRSAPLLVLEFPSFGDGRAYSQARLLRDAQRYTGELRASGAAVVRDQLLGMVRCGIDSFELRADQRAAECIEALKEFSIAYQPAMDALPRVRELRRHVS